MTSNGTVSVGWECHCNRLPALQDGSPSLGAWGSAWLCKEISAHGEAPPSPKRFMGTCWTQKQQQLIMVSTAEKLVATATTSSTAALG